MLIGFEIQLKWDNPSILESVNIVYIIEEVKNIQRMEKKYFILHRKLSFKIFPSIDMANCFHKKEGLSWSWSYGSWILQISVQSAPIATKAVSSNPVHGEVYSIQPCVIKFVSDLRQVDAFLWILKFPPPIKLTATI